MTYCEHIYIYIYTDIYLYLFFLGSNAAYAFLRIGDLAQLSGSAVWATESFSTSPDSPHLAGCGGTTAKPEIQKFMAMKRHTQKKTGKENKERKDRNFGGKKRRYLKMHCLERCKFSSKAVEKQESKPTELQPSVQLLPALISSHPRPSPSFSPQIPTLDCKLWRQIIANQGLTKQNQQRIIW